MSEFSCTGHDEPKKGCDSCWIVMTRMVRILTYEPPEPVSPTPTVVTFTSDEQRCDVAQEACVPAHGGNCAWHWSEPRLGAMYQGKFPANDASKPAASSTARG